MKTTKLLKISACMNARAWVATQKNYKEAWQNCERGDWMLWLGKKLNVDDRKLTMAKAMCAKQVEHLMKDQRSRDALQACIDYFNGLISREQLTAYADAAADAAAAAAADAAAYAAAYAVAYAAAAAADAVAREQSLNRSADICREYLTEEVLTAYRKIR